MKVGELITMLRQAKDASQELCDMASEIRLTGRIATERSKELEIASEIIDKLVALIESRDIE